MVEKIKNSLLIISLLLLSGCASIDKTPPKQVSDACAIFDEKAKWEKPVFEAANDWGISPGTILAIIRQESSFRYDARPRDKDGNLLSSAYGFSQALNGTWQDYERDQGKAKRKNFRDAADFIGWYGDKITKRTQIDKRDSRAIYLAFHEGPGGYNRATYVAKPWLLKIADKVATNAQTYDAQLYKCSRRKMKKFANNQD
jgi:hypothetical protein